jgi:hypothetical protein
MTITEPTPGGPPAPRHLPVEIAPDTFVVQATQGEGVAPVAVHLNAMVIRGSEPIIVDTGVAGRDYLEDFWSLVDPADVRWVFLSHDDPDHYGNLVEVMEACPDAVLVTSWFQWERMGELLPIAPRRMRWVDDGETFEANGRIYLAARPPAYDDSPTTRGLFDTATGVYWGSDCFFTPVPRGAADIGELAPEDWEMALPVAARPRHGDARAGPPRSDRGRGARRSGLVTAAIAPSGPIAGDGEHLVAAIARPDDLGFSCAAGAARRRDRFGARRAPSRRRARARRERRRS